MKVENLFSLEDIAGHEAELSKKYNSSVCMDSFVAKSLFKAECLASPIISAEATVPTNRVPVIFIAVVISCAALAVIGGVLLFGFRRHFT